MFHRAVEELPADLPFLPIAEEEMRHTPELEKKIFMRRSKDMWVLSDQANNTLMVAGITQPTIMSTPELWVLLCKDFKKNLRQNLIETKAKISELLNLYPHVMARVDAQTPVGQHFVQFFGFEEYHRETHGDREYIYYEVRRGDRNSSRH